MPDIEERLRTAMHAAIDGEEASADYLIRMVQRRHRLHVRQLATAALVIVALAVPTAIGLHSALTAGVKHTAGPVTPAAKLPARLTGLPMPAGTQFELLLPTSRGAGWYSTATRRIAPIAGLPATPGGYKFARLSGGWAAWPVEYGSPCAYNLCAGPPTTFYFIADGSLTATRIGTGYAGDGTGPGTTPGTVWLVTYPGVRTPLTSWSYAQLVSTAGNPLGSRYRLPADTLMGRGAGKYLLLVLDTGTEGHSELWDPKTGRVLGHFENVVGQGPEQIVWSSACRTCTLQVTNVSTGKTMATSIAASQPANLNATLSDDGQLLAVQLASGQLAVLSTATGSLTRIPGTALSSADFENFAWQNGGHRLIITTGPQNEPGPDQIAYWQPGDSHIYVATVRNLHEIPEIETGAVG